MWCKLAHCQHAGVQTTLATAMRALNNITRGTIAPNPAFSSFPHGSISALGPSLSPAAPAAASCSPRCRLPPPPATLTSHLSHLHRPRAAFCSSAFLAPSSSQPFNAPPSTSTTTTSDAASAAAAAAVSPLRFRANRRRMSALERAAAAAHDALAEAKAAAAAAAAPKHLPSTPKGGSSGWPVVAAAAAAAGGGGGSSSATALRAASRLPAAAVGSEAAEGEEGAEGEEEMDEEERQAVEQRRRFVGQLQGVPHVVSASEQLASARKRAAKVAPSAGIKNAAEKERNRAARRLDLLMQALSVPLGRYVASFPPPGRLHPFEQQLLALSVGEAAYCGALQRVDRLRRAVQEVGKSAAARAASAPNKAAATAACEEGAAAIEAVFSAGARHVDALKEVAKSLRSLPSLDPSLPTLALVGAPNVGKSSLVHILSSGTPEVCNYPFTTRSIKMGHFYLDAQKHQVTDTPGLLRRPDSARNRMERLTLAALGCLDAAAVLFVADLTAQCGTSVADQWAIRSELRSRFPGRPWIDVLSKTDMLQDVFTAADELIRQRSTAAAAAAAPQLPAATSHSDAVLAVASQAGAIGADPSPAAPISLASSSSSPAALQGGVAGASTQLSQQQQQHGQQPVGEGRGDEERQRQADGGGEEGSGGEEGGEEEEEVGAVEMAARLPGAVRISSLTHDGIPQLQLAIIRTLRAAAQARQEQLQAQAQAQQAQQALGDSQQQLQLHGRHGPASVQAPRLPVVTFFGPP